MNRLSKNRRDQIAQDEARANRCAEILVPLDGSLTFARRERLAHILSEAEAAALAKLADGQASGNTLRALATDLEQIVEWHRALAGGNLPWPPSPDLLHLWLNEALAQTPAPSPATLKRRLTSCARLTRAMGFDDASFQDASLRARIGTDDEAARQTTAVLGEEGLARLLSACPTDTLAGLRDRALLITAFTLGLGPTALAALKVEEIADGALGGLRIERHRKRALQLSEPAANALRQWLARSGLASGPLFRPVDRWMKPGRLGLTPQSVKLIVKARAAQVGLDPARLSARSLR